MGLMGAVGKVEVLEQDAPDPKGTLRDVVNEKCTIFMEAQGLDLTKEHEKLMKKMTTAEKTIASYEAKMAVSDYEAKVPANAQEMNLQKLEASRKELEEFKRAAAIIVQVIQSQL